jgi:hypothetical protein
VGDHIHYRILPNGRRCIRNRDGNLTGFSVERYSVINVLTSERINMVSEPARFRVDFHALCVEAVIDGIYIADSL